MHTIFLYIGLFGLSLALPALVVAVIYRQNFCPLLGFVSRLRRLPGIARVAIAAFVVQMIVYGSTKTNSPPPRLVGDGPQTVFGFTPEQFAAGFVMSRVGFGESWDFAPGEGSAPVGEWWLRGASDDVVIGPSFAPIASAPMVFADGRVQDRVRSPMRLYAPLNASLGVVPEANWGLIAKTNAQSAVWLGTTASNSLVVTWRDVLLRRDTNLPVSVQAEFFENGNFAYRYDLSRAASALSALSAESNVVVGAWRGGVGESLDPSCVTNPAVLTSVFFHALTDEDALTADRDGDGLSTYDEIFTYRTDPGLCDTDGDGMTDGYEVAQSLDPLCVSVSNEVLLARLEDFQTNRNYAAASIVVTNELVGYRLWDSFTAAWPSGATNLVYERTVSIDRREGWQQYYLSSRPDSAGGWSLGGMVLEWEDSCGESGTATASPVADSLYLPLSTNGPSSVTFRLRATSTALRSVNPVYLIGYAPRVSILGGDDHTTAAGERLAIFTDGSESVIGLSVDRSRRPCLGALHPLELAMAGMADIASRTRGRLRYEGGADGGRLLASGAGVYRLPDFSVHGVSQVPAGLRGAAPGEGGQKLVVLMPWVDYVGHHCSDDWVYWDDEEEEYDVEYEYPLDSGCLVREWHRDSDGAWCCDCEPRAGSGIADDNGLVTVILETEDDTATAYVKVDGETVWSDKAVHVPDSDDCDGSHGIEREDECGECGDGCANGDCSGLEGPSLGSLKFRIPTGMPRKGQVAGFAYFVTEGPMLVTPASFEYLLRNDVGASVSTNGSARTVACACERGRELVIEPIQNGTRVTVNAQDTGKLEHVWEIVNVGGSASEIRIRQISRLNNVMQDWTYEYVCDAYSGEWNWRATDNVSGVREDLDRVDSLNVDGTVSETRTKYDASGNWLGSVETHSQIIGERECAVLRQVYRCETTDVGTIERFADYWRDTAHPARNGKLRLLRADDAPWEYHEWNADGFETLRVEQRNGSEVPEEFPFATSNGFENAAGLADAFLTTFSYEPLGGDDAHADDYGKVRCESRYVVRGGVATLTGRTWRRYTHLLYGGRPAVREETWRAMSASAQFGDAANAYSWRTVFDPIAAGNVPLVLRGEVAEEMDEDGVRTAAEVSVADGRVVLTRRKWRGGLQFPTYDVAEMDDTYGLVSREAKCLSGGDAVVDETTYVHDDQSRLRSAAYYDGTSTTNAYSCCRLLWSRDRQGRKVLRSALTGQDGLYYAEEEVWLQDVASNGYKVTQHFMDGLGRETNTVVYVGSVPGEATDLSVSDGRRLSEEIAQYLGMGYDAVDSADVRGKVESRCTYFHPDREVSFTDTYADWQAAEPLVRTIRTEVRNGPCSTRREWDGKWTERRTWSDYDAAGCMVDYEITVSSDCGTVTNAVTRHDFLGRRVASEGPSGTETTVYDGSTSRALSTTTAAGGVVRTAENVYNDFGELVGSISDGVASWRDETYEQVSNVWWKVERSVVFSGGATNSASEVRERVTGLSDAVRSQVVRVSADGVATETTESYDPVADVTVETTLSPTGGTLVRTLRHGLVLSAESPDGTTVYSYDALGRTVREACGPRVSESEYSAAGDVVARRTRTEEGLYAEESYAYDTCGNRVAETNALGGVIATAYDAVGNVVEISGTADYPVRFAYDTEGRRTLLSTTRDGTIWDVTTWEYDPATGRCLAKRHADGSRYATTYTPDGLESVVTRPSLQWRENVYDARRRLVGVTSNDGSENAAFEHDDFGRVTAASNAVASFSYMLHRNGTATNEFASIGTNGFEIGRTIDMFGRLDGRGVAGSEFQGISYDAAGRVWSITGQTATVTYAYSEDGMEAGCAISLAAGSSVVRQVVRDLYRPDLVVTVSNVVNGVAVSGFDYQHDACGRVLSRNGDSFAYNDRGEVVGAVLGGQADSYAYDQIGNFTDAVFGGTTNTYAANELNQYTSILCASAPLREISHNADGNVASDGAFGYAYDSAGRLSSVSTGGVVVAAFQYDALGRRVRKTTPEATHTYLYDGWSLVLERIEREGGEADTVEYFWGKDISGSLGGAGGIGGLLYLKHNGAAYVPLYDANGNVVQYVDATGAIVASYVYDAFGRTLASAGSQAELFRFRFSTKYHDPESGLVYYGYRFYSPSLMRWLSRDPLEEEGGLNLYGFCQNNPVCNLDPYGLSNEFAKKIAAKFFWLAFAEYYFKRLAKFPISAEMLTMSAVGNVGPGEHKFPEGGQLANAIKGSSEYKKVIAQLVDKQNASYKYYDLPKKSIDFGAGDLKTAVGKASYDMKGGVCKTKKGEARLDLRFKVFDDYDFHKWGEHEKAVRGFVLGIGNNMAYDSQMKGYLTVYPWSVSFDEKRKWPWK